MNFIFGKTKKKQIDLAWYELVLWVMITIERRISHRNIEICFVLFKEIFFTIQSDFYHFHSYTQTRSIKFIIRLFNKPWELYSVVIVTSILDIWRGYYIDSWGWIKATQKKLRNDFAWLRSALQKWNAPEKYFRRARSYCCAIRHVNPSAPYLSSIFIIIYFFNT